MDKLVEVVEACDCQKCFEDPPIQDGAIIDDFSYYSYYEDDI